MGHLLGSFLGGQRLERLRVTRSHQRDGAADSSWSVSEKQANAIFSGKMSLCLACNAISCSVHSLYYPHISSKAALPPTHSFSCSFAEKEHAFQPTKQALASDPLPGPLINKAQPNPFAPTAPLTCLEDTVAFLDSAVIYRCKTV
jgi:hypothetical protein